MDMDWKEHIINELKDFRKETNERLEKIDDKQESMNLDLKEHMYRTEQNEQMINAIKEELKPIKEHVDGLRYSGKLVVGLAAAIGVIVGAITKVKGMW
jgi:lipid II:glycine glycyltransferase (peptidoglycan interpeptide bridge formation enzyme)